LGQKDKSNQSAAVSVIEATASSPWTDLGLTLPVFVAYHLGVLFLPVRNAADWMTRRLIELSENDTQSYVVLTVCMGVAYTGTLIALGRGQALRGGAFAWLLAEAAAYAIAMRFVALYVVGEVFLGAGALVEGPFSGLVLSLGAGFYEELAFRVVLFGWGFALVTWLFSVSGVKRRMLQVCWAVGSALIFSLWHYVGALGDPFEPRSFVFRWVCGLVFCAIYTFRGFAPVVWTHVLYDVWVMVL
jgi:Type II CAAX prenyl endopeptidase Rce1-like